MEGRLRVNRVDIAAWVAKWLPNIPSNIIPHHIRVHAFMLAFGDELLLVSHASRPRTRRTHRACAPRSRVLAHDHARESGGTLQSPHTGASPHARARESARTRAHTHARAHERARGHALEGKNGVPEHAPTKPSCQPVHKIKPARTHGLLDVAAWSAGCSSQLGCTGSTCQVSTAPSRRRRTSSGARCTASGARDRNGATRATLKSSRFNSTCVEPEIPETQTAAQTCSHGGGGHVAAGWDR
jgi:hypothetical protein